MRVSKKHFATVLIAVLLVMGKSNSQNLGFGNNNPTLGKIHVTTNGTKPLAIFGGESIGVSINKLPSAANGISLGLNVYFDNISYRYLANGHGAAQFFNSDNREWGFLLFPAGNAGLMATATKPFVISSAGLKIQTTLATGGFEVGRGNGIATATFAGTNYTSYINYSTSEDTYIRGGKPGSKVIFNDIGTSGGTTIGYSESLVGINRFNPVTTLDVVQAGFSGIALVQVAGDFHFWEFFVHTNGPFELWYSNSSNIRYYRGNFDPVSGAYFSVSDQRFKKEIESLGTSIDKIIRLEAKTYDFIDNLGHQRSVGLLAQDVYQLFPELVGIKINKEAPIHDLHSLNYAGFSVLAVKAIQEQQAIIDKLKIQNAKIRARLDRLKLTL